VRVLTLNLWGRSGAWAERRSVLIDGLRELRPDLVAFQEPIKTDDYDQVLDLLGSGFHVVHHNAGLVGAGTTTAPRSRAAGHWEKYEKWT
jgi:hypothetical protein